MADTHPVTVKRSLSLGDAAVNGLFAGILAGLAMALFLVIAGWLGGDDPGVVLGRFSPDGGTAPLTGVLLHLAVSGIYGTLFGVGYRLIIQPWRGIHTGWLAVLAGLAYGLGLWALARWILLPGSGSILSETPAWDLLLAHALYGLVLGWLFNRT